MEPRRGRARAECVIFLKLIKITQKLYYYTGSFQRYYAIRLAEQEFSFFFLVPKSTIRFLRDIKNIAMLNASVALYTSARFYFKLQIEK